MKRAEYALPFGVHPLLEPKETGRTPSVTKKINGVDTEVGNKPIYSYQTVTTPESETLDELFTLVEASEAHEHTRKLGQGALDIIRQRKIREYASSEEAANLLEGKSPDTANASEAERVAHVLGLAQSVGDEYVYGVVTQRAGAGAGVKAKAEKLDAIKAARETAAADPTKAKQVAKLDQILADLGITL